jgi:TetR/AcrR family transcriptional regulator, cholesterol catabolism regulator
VKKTTALPRAAARSDPLPVSPGRREEILDAAARLFHQRGYNGTSVQDIVDEVGLLKGSLYHYIKSKDDLLYEIIVKAHEGYFENMRRCIALDADAATKLREFIEGHVRVAAGNAVNAGVYNQDFKSLSADRREEITAKREQYGQFLRKLISTMAKSGKVSADIDPRVTSTLILAVLTSVHRWYDRERSLTVDQIASQIADFVFRGLTLEV